MLIFEPAAALSRKPVAPPPGSVIVICWVATPRLHEFVWKMTSSLDTARRRAVRSALPTGNTVTPLIEIEYMRSPAALSTDRPDRSSASRNRSRMVRLSASTICSVGGSVGAGGIVLGGSVIVRHRPSGRQAVAVAGGGAGGSGGGICA